MWCMVSLSAEGVSQWEAMQTGAELQCFSFAPLCNDSSWLTSLGRKPRHTQWSLAAEVTNALHTGKMSAMLNSLISIVTSKLKPRSQSLIYIVKVVISQRWWKAEKFLTETTRKWCMAYQIMPFPMTMSDLQHHSPIASLFMCNFSYSCEPADNGL